MRGLPLAAAAASAERLLDELGLAAAADRDVARYSTGMRARLALARARIGEPRLIVLDEVGRGLDAAGAEQFVAWLRSPGRPAVVAATHALEQAAGVADRIVLLERGRIAGELPGDGASVAAVSARVRALAS